MKVSVATDVGRNCITLDQGERVYDAIHPVLKAGEPVELDFVGVSVFASPFFNAAIGRLLADIKPDSLNSLLRIDHLSLSGLEVLKHVIENSKNYYSDPKEQAALDRILADQASGE